MLIQYIEEAMKRAHYSLSEDGGTFYGEIPGLPGVRVEAKNLEQCRRELQIVLGEWLVFQLAQHSAIPPLGDVRIDVPPPRQYVKLTPVGDRVVGDAQKSVSTFSRYQRIAETTGLLPSFNLKDNLLHLSYLLAGFAIGVVLEVLLTFPTTLFGGFKVFLQISPFALLPVVGGVVGFVVGGYRVMCRSAARH